MKLLVIGSGGREHALVWKLAQSPHITQLWCAPDKADAILKFIHAQKHKAWLVGEVMKGSGEPRVM